MLDSTPHLFLLKKILSALILPPISQAQLKNIQAIVILGGGKNNNAPEYELTPESWTVG